ncbi:MAG: amino acid transporter [Candidatus Paceibacterota bacterium]
MNIHSTYTPDQAFQLLKDLKCPWWIAGGWALDLFIGETTRDHEDLDIAILRRDQFLVRDYLRNWEMRIGLGNGEISDAQWDGATYIEVPVPAIWCKQEEQKGWAFEFLLTESNEDHWQSRRDPSITLPLNKIGTTTASGIPYVLPEIVLSYKAKERGLEKDQDDFNKVLPLLNEKQRGWLKQTLEITNPGHAWLRHL